MVICVYFLFTYSSIQAMDEDHTVESGFLHNIRMNNRNKGDVLETQLAAICDGNRRKANDG